MSLMIGAAVAFTGCKAEGNSTETTVTAPRLVSKVTKYTLAGDSTEWEEDDMIEITYNKSYPVNIASTQYGETSQRKLEYTFDGDVPTKRVERNEDLNTTITLEYNKGRIYNWYEESDDGNLIQRRFLQYGNDDEYFTMIFHERYFKGETPEEEDHAEESDAVSVYTENGLLKKTINTGMYANWGFGSDKEWLRFNGTYAVDYDINGIASVLSAVYRAGSSGIQQKNDIKIENGVVTEVICSIPTESGDYIPFEKYVFEYTDTEISPSRYATMINAFIMGEQGTYYWYMWY